MYVANESDQEVFFDELEVAHTPTLIAQENHYYPYGMNMVGIEKQGMPHHRFQFNAQTERETAFHLHWDETPFRRYDAQLGRFHGVDALASSYAGITPYQYGFNNPVMFNDPSGLSPNKSGQEMIDWAMGQLDGYNRTQYNGSVAGTADSDRWGYLFGGAFVQERNNDALLYPDCPVGANGVPYIFDGKDWVREGGTLPDIIFTLKSGSGRGTPSPLKPTSNTVDDGGSGISNPLWWLTGAFGTAASIIPFTIRINTNLLKAGLKELDGSDVLWTKHKGIDYRVSKTTFEGVDGIELLQKSPDGSQKLFYIFPNNPQTTVLQILKNDDKELMKTYQSLFKGDFKGALQKTESRLRKYGSLAIDGVDKAASYLLPIDRGVFSRSVGDALKLLRAGGANPGTTYGQKTGSETGDVIIQIITFAISKGM